MGAHDQNPVIVRWLVALVTAAACWLAVGLVDDSGWLGPMAAIVLFAGALAVPKRRTGTPDSGHERAGLVLATIVAALLAVAGWGVVIAGYAGCSEPGPENSCDLLNDDVVGLIILVAATGAPLLVIAGGVLAVRRGAASALAKAALIALGFYAALLVLSML
jgi:hypothetical protein